MKKHLKSEEAIPCNRILKEIYYMTDQPPIIPSGVEAIPPPPPPPPSRGVFGTKIPTSLALGLALLFFFMPFVDIRCNNMSLQKISGFQLATGVTLKTSGNDSFMGSFDKADPYGSPKSSNGGKREGNSYALAALLLTVLGLALCLFLKKGGGIAALLTGVLGAISMIVLMVDIKGDIRSEIGDASKDGVAISVDFTPVFYLTILLLLLAAYFGYKRTKEV